MSPLFTAVMIWPFCSRDISLRFVKMKHWNTLIHTYQSHIKQVSRTGHLHSPESHQSSLKKASSFTRVTSVKSANCRGDWLTDWLMVSRLYWCDSGEWRCLIETWLMWLWWVGIYDCYLWNASCVVGYDHHYNQGYYDYEGHHGPYSSHINQVCRRHPHSPESHPSSL